MAAIKHFALFSLLAVYSGCATYQIGGETFSSPEDALWRQSELAAAALEQILPTTQAPDGHALILLPSMFEIEHNFANIRALGSGISEKQVEFLTSGIDKQLVLVANAIKRRRIFDSVTIMRHDGDPGMAPIEGYDCLIFADVDGWSFKARSDKRATRVESDKTLPSFLDVIERLARDATTTGY